MQNSRDTGVLVSRTPTFPEECGVKTTRPSGTTADPWNPLKGARFEQVMTTGSIIWILEETMRTLPEGRRLPDVALGPEPGILDHETGLTGLKTTAFEHEYGTNSTLP